MVDHTYCYTPAVLKIRELIADGDARRHPVRRLRAHQPRPDPARRRRLLGPRARTTCRSSTSSCPAGSTPTGGRGHGADPLGAGQVLRRLPDHAAARRRRSRTCTSTGSARPRSARWSSAAAGAPWSGTTSTRSSGSASTTAVSTSRSSRADTTERAAANVSYRLGDTWAPALPETRGARRRWSSEFAAAIREGRAAAHRRRARACACCRCSRRPRRSLGRGAAYRSIRHRLATDSRSACMTALEGATVLVTGGAGTIGSTIVDQLLDAGAGARRRARQPRPRPPGEPRRRAGRPAGSSWSRATSATATWCTT